MPRRRPFTDTLKALADEDKTLSPANRADLVRLADSRVVETIWTSIERVVGRQSRLMMRFFIRETLAARRLAVAEEWPDFPKHAKMSRNLAKFLKGSGRLPPPLPFPGMDKFILTLENVAAKLDEVAQHSRMHISRKNTARSREHAVFMRLMGMQMQELFGRWLDNEVADLTNILFPQRTTTRETVSATRRTTQKARARKH